MEVLGVAGNFVVAGFTGSIAYGLLRRDNGLNSITKTVITAGILTCYHFALKSHKEWILQCSTMILSREIEFYKDLGLYVMALIFGLWIISKQLKSDNRLIDMSLFSLGHIFINMTILMILKSDLSSYINTHPTIRIKC